MLYCYQWIFINFLNFLLYLYVTNVLVLVLLYIYILKIIFYYKHMITNKYLLFIIIIEL